MARQAGRAAGGDRDIHCDGDLDPGDLRDRFRGNAEEYGGYERLEFFGDIAACFGKQLFGGIERQLAAEQRFAEQRFAKYRFAKYRFAKLYGVVR